MTMTSTRERGIALVVVLLTIVLLSALGVALVLATSAETRIAANFRTAQQTLYAAEAAADRALDDLALAPDWNTILSGGVRSSFVDGSPGGVRQLDDGSTIDLGNVMNLANSEVRPWGPNNPQWLLFAFGPLQTLLPPGAAPVPQYIVVMAADDASETDNDPSRDAVAGNPGADILALRAEAFGPGGAHKVVELTVARGTNAVRVLSWRELR